MNKFFRVMPFLAMVALCGHPNRAFAQLPFSDTFPGPKLDPAWSFLLPGNYDLSGNPNENTEYPPYYTVNNGFHIIDAVGFIQPGASYLYNVPSVTVGSGATGDYDIRFTVASNFFGYNGGINDGAGLLIFGDTGNYFQLMTTGGFDSFASAFLAQGSSAVGDYYNLTNYQYLGYDPVAYHINKTDTTITFSYSEYGYETVMGTATAADTDPFRAGAYAFLSDLSGKRLGLFTSSLFSYFGQVDFTDFSTTLPLHNTITNPISATDIVVDGQFTDGVVNGQVIGEWADITPGAFISPASASGVTRPTFLSDPNATTLVYSCLDGGEDALYLQYVSRLRTNPNFLPGQIAAAVSFPFSFPAGGVFGAGGERTITIQAIANGSGGFDFFVHGEPKGSDPAFDVPISQTGMAGAVGFGPSPLTSTPHLIVELEVPLEIPAGFGGVFPSGGVHPLLGGLLPLPNFWETRFANNNGTLVTGSAATIEVANSASTTLQPTSSTPDVIGRIALEGVADLTAISPGAPLGTFHLSFRTPGTTTEVFGADVTLSPVGGSDPNGAFSIPGVPAGTYDVWVKGDKNLAVSLPGVVVSGAVTLPDMLLLAGDSNNDNMVDVIDFSTLVNAFGAPYDPNNPNNGYDPTADFNFDGAVDVADFGILVNEYGIQGAP